MIKNDALQAKYADTGHELCGFITNGEIVDVPNSAPEPDKGFLIDSLIALHYVENLSATATWHTHPGTTSNLSGDDYAMFRAWPDLTHYIVGNDGIRGYRYDRDKKAVVEL